MTSPFGRSYCRTLRWVSSDSSSLRMPLCRRTSAAAHSQNAESSASVTLISSQVSSSRTRTGGSVSVLESL